MHCLDENAVLDMLAGRLASAELSAVDQHCAACEDCRSLLLEVRASSEPPASVDAPVASSAWLGALGLEQTLSILDRALALTAGTCIAKRREKLLVAHGEKPARVADYSGRGALGAWVRVAALRTALSLRRGRAAEPSPHSLPEQAAAITAPENRALRRRFRPLLKAAVQRALESIDEAERTLLRLHVIEGLTVEQLGVRHGVHGSTISRRITRTRAFLLEETRRLLLLEGRLNESEFTSVVRVLRSDLEVSLRRILGAVG